MKIFIDSANIEEIRKAIEIGCEGVTTNPSLIKLAAKELSVQMEDYIKELCRTAGKNRPVSLEVISLDCAGMMHESQILYNRFNKNKNVVVKIPFGIEGLKALRELKKKGIKTNATLIMSPEQALLAAKAGADYASPFAGRIDDLLRAGKEFKKEAYYPAEGTGIDDNGIVSGIDLIKKIVNIFRNYNIRSEIIAASLRNARQVREVALTGCDIATIPYKVMEEMTRHMKTTEGIEKFSEDVVPEYRKVFE